MSSLPLHPALVHVPLGLAVVLPLLAVALAIRAFRSGAPRAAVAALVALQAVLFASGLLAGKLGEADEDRVERVTGEAAIERHEERAEAFVWGAGIVLAGAAALLVAPRRAHAAGLGVLAAATVAVAALAVRTGQAGGELVYTHGAASAWVPAAPGAPAAMPAAAEVEHDD